MTTRPRCGVARKVAVAVRCRNSVVMAMAPRTATRGLAPAAMANRVCWPGAVSSGGMTALSAKAMFRLTYSATSAVEASSSHSHSRVEKSLENSAAISWGMSDHLVQGSGVCCCGQGEEDGREVAVPGGELVSLDAFGEGDPADAVGVQSD